MDDLLGTRISHYRIIDFLSKGGMGDLYVGFDEKLNRKVALKSIQPDNRLLADAKTRFLREARILSQLAHPNICQIFDYIEGESADFLVLELIPGQNLSDVMRKKLDFKEKLKIAQQIAAVLVTAHGQNIIHRDLKPDNVMLDEEGRVKVLDFGLSRSQREEMTLRLIADESGTLHPFPAASGEQETVRADGEPARFAAKLTEAGMIMGTIQYMSPEQARGENATTASDLYSFGLILQELFTGRPVYDRGLNFKDLQKKVMAGETLPVEGVDAGLTALIQRLKSLAPAARPTAVDTAEKISWMQNRPQRRRKSMLLAAAIAVSILFAAAMAVQTRRAIQAEKSALTEAATARQVSEFLINLFRVSDPNESRGSTVTARELLDRGAARITNELKEQPAVQARLMNTMGLVYQMLGLFRQAQPLLESALAIREKNLGPGHDDVAESLNGLATLYREQGKYAAAEPLFRRSLAIYEKNHGPDSDSVADCANNLAILYENQGKYAPAEALYRRSLAIRENIQGPFHAKVADSLNDLADLFRIQGKFAEADPLFRRSLEIRERTLGRDHIKVGYSLNNLAILLREQGRNAEAEPLYQRCLTIFEKALGPDHTHVGAILNNLARLYTKQGKYADAEPLFKRSLAIYEKALGPDHVNVAECMESLASLYSLQNKYAQAESLFKSSLEIFAKALGPDHANMAECLESMAGLYLRQGKYSLAETFFRRSLVIFEKALGPGHISSARCLESLGRLYQERGLAATAEPLFLRSLAIFEKALGRQHPKVATGLLHLAQVNARLGKNEDAIAFLVRSLAVGGDLPWKRSIGEDPELASLHGNPDFERIAAEAKRGAQADRLPPR
jgi:serine/threonine protein kinase/Tfp pilus assembly protein PilF